MTKSMAANSDVQAYKDWRNSDYIVNRLRSLEQSKPAIAEKFMAAIQAVESQLGIGQDEVRDTDKIDSGYTDGAKIAYYNIDFKELYQFIINRVDATRTDSMLLDSLLNLLEASLPASPQKYRWVGITATPKTLKAILSIFWAAILSDDIAINNNGSMDVTLTNVLSVYSNTPDEVKPMLDLSQGYSLLPVDAEAYSFALQYTDLYDDIQGGIALSTALYRILYLATDGDGSPLPDYRDLYENSLTLIANASFPKADVYAAVLVAFARAANAHSITPSRAWALIKDGVEYNGVYYDIDKALFSNNDEQKQLIADTVRDSNNANDITTVLSGLHKPKKDWVEATKSANSKAYVVASASLALSGLYQRNWVAEYLHTKLKVDVVYRRGGKGGKISTESISSLLKVPKVESEGASVLSDSYINMLLKANGGVLAMWLTATREELHQLAKERFNLTSSDEILFITVAAIRCVDIDRLTANESIEGRLHAIKEYKVASGQLEMVWLPFLPIEVEPVSTDNKFDKVYEYVKPLDYSEENLAKILPYEVEDSPEQQGIIYREERWDEERSPDQEDVPPQPDDKPANKQSEEEEGMPQLPEPEQIDRTLPDSFNDFIQNGAYEYLVVMPEEADTIIATLQKLRKEFPDKSGDDFADDEKTMQIWVDAVMDNLEDLTAYAAKKNAKGVLENELTRIYYKDMKGLNAWDNSGILIKAPKPTQKLVEKELSLTDAAERLEQERKYLKQSWGDDGEWLSMFNAFYINEESQNKIFLRYIDVLRGARGLTTNSKKQLASLYTMITAIKGLSNPEWESNDSIVFTVSESGQMGEIANYKNYVVNWFLTQEDLPLNLGYWSIFAAWLVAIKQKYSAQGKDIGLVEAIAGIKSSPIVVWPDPLIKITDKDFEAKALNRFKDMAAELGYDAEREQPKKESGQGKPLVSERRASEFFETSKGISVAKFLGGDWDKNKYAEWLKQQEDELDADKYAVMLDVIAASLGIDYKKYDNRPLAEFEDVIEKYIKYAIQYYPMYAYAAAFPREEMYQYLLTQRPPSIGTHPEGTVADAIEIDNPYREGRIAWILTYDRPLTEEEIKSYELREMPDAETQKSDSKEQPQQTPSDDDDDDFADFMDEIEQVEKSINEVNDLLDEEF